MTVKLYVGKDEDRPWEPDHRHEVEAIREIAKAFWLQFHHSDTVYVLVANIHNPSADLVVLTQRGLGVVEMKHVPGVVTIRDDGWYCDNRFITSAHQASPHMQVQKYADDIRDKTLPFLLPKQHRTDSSYWNKFKYQTAVCFTNPAVDVSGIKNSLLTNQRIRRKPWESDFAVLLPEELPAWAFSLRFVADLGPSKGFKPYRLEPTTLISVAQNIFEATEWTELVALMPDGLPWGSLVTHGNEYPQSFQLSRDIVTIGRAPDNTIVVPDKFHRVSRTHAQITRDLNSVTIEDLSKNGLYINSEKITGKRPLTHDQIIVFGGPQATLGNFALQFKLSPVEKPKVEVTRSQ